MNKPELDRRLLLPIPIEYHEYAWERETQPNSLELARLCGEIARDLLIAYHKIPFFQVVRPCPACGTHGDLGLYAVQTSLN